MRGFRDPDQRRRACLLLDSLLVETGGPTTIGMAGHPDTPVISEMLHWGTDLNGRGLSEGQRVLIRFIGDCWDGGARTAVVDLAWLDSKRSRAVIGLMFALAGQPADVDHWLSWAGDDVPPSAPRQPLRVVRTSGEGGSSDQDRV